MPIQEAEDLAFRLRLNKKFERDITFKPSLFIKDIWLYEYLLFRQQQN
jgi:hypothetical protein